MITEHEGMKTTETSDDYPFAFAAALSRLGDLLELPVGSILTIDVEAAVRKLLAENVRLRAIAGGVVNSGDAAGAPPVQ